MTLWPRHISFATATPDPIRRAAADLAASQSALRAARQRLAQQARALVTSPPALTLAVATGFVLAEVQHRPKAVGPTAATEENHSAGDFLTRLAGWIQLGSALLRLFP